MVFKMEGITRVYIAMRGYPNDLITLLHIIAQARNGVPSNTMVKYSKEGSYNAPLAPNKVINSDLKI